VRENQHRWKQWLLDDDRIREILEEAAEVLDWAWKEDQRYPGRYPLNTSYHFCEIAEKIRNKPPVRRRIKLPPPPQSLAELVDDRTIGSVYEDQNNGSYKDALIQASAGFGKGVAALRKILHALEGAYAIHYLGNEFAPKPRVHFLHRNLFDIARLAKLIELTNSAKLSAIENEGIAEFLDDTCPCGKKHTPDAIRKLRKRWAGVSRSKP
jgi:hypothetical protein